VILILSRRGQTFWKILSMSSYKKCKYLASTLNNPEEGEVSSYYKNFDDTRHAVQPTREVAKILVTRRGIVITKINILSPSSPSCFFTRSPAIPVSTITPTDDKWEETFIQKEEKVPQETNKQKLRAILTIRFFGHNTHALHTTMLSLMTNLVMKESVSLLTLQIV
jgi:hypothetical protein